MPARATDSPFSMAVTAASVVVAEDGFQPDWVRASSAPGTSTSTPPRARSPHPEQLGREAANHLQADEPDPQRAARLGLAARRVR